MTPEERNIKRHRVAWANAVVATEKASAETALRRQAADRTEKDWKDAWDAEMQTVRYADACEHRYLDAKEVKPDGTSVS